MSEETPGQEGQEGQQPQNPEDLQPQRTEPQVGRDQETGHEAVPGA